MCADHGVWHEGVAISPQAVTAIQAINMTRKNTGVCVLAAQAGAQVHVVDAGIDADPIPGLVDMRVARGGNICPDGGNEPGTGDGAAAGQHSLYARTGAQGVRVFGVGELGMANTTPAAAVVSVLTGNDAQDVVGIGANLPVSQLGHKADVVRRAIAVNQPQADDGLDVLAKVGGFDLVGMTGVMLGAASCGLPVVLDGFLSYASALAACRLARRASVSDPFTSVGGKRGAYRAGTSAAEALSGYGYAAGRGQRRRAGDASCAGGVHGI
jgi:nicotinate-nucleotide--dimethylbenzimidazole phosphoribosyltransferase